MGLSFCLKFYPKKLVLSGFTVFICQFRDFRDFNFNFDINFDFDFNFKFDLDFAGFEGLDSFVF